MIVKDEERMLPRSLNSIRECVDEIVVVDTGSHDNTVKIAKSFGAKVYHHAWEKNFSKHRNQSIGYATGEWILQIDADEELLNPSREALLRATHVPETVEGIYVCMENASPTGVIETNLIRIFRNKKRIHFRGRVHNDLTGVQETAYSGIRFFHYGYNLGQKVDDKKYRRTTELLKLDISENPKNARSWHFLSVSYMAAKKHHEAAECAVQAIALFEENNSIVAHDYLWSLYVAAGSYLNVGDLDKAVFFSEKAISFFPNFLDGHYVLSHVYMARNHPTLFWKHYARYLQVIEKIRKEPEAFGQILHNTLPLKWKLHLFAGCMALTEGKTKKSEDAFEAGSTICENKYTWYMELGRVFLSRGQLNEAERAYKKALEIVPCDFHSVLDLVRIYEEKGDIKNGRSFLQYLERMPFDQERAFHLALACQKNGHMDVAKALFTRLLDIDSDNCEAYISYATLCCDASDHAGCARSRGELLRILGIENTSCGNTPTELAADFFAIAESLYKHSDFSMSKKCLQIAQSLISKKGLCDKTRHPVRK
jgi:glycosyltransferase involved in cell wall biosynthesis